VHDTDHDAVADRFRTTAISGASASCLSCLPPAPLLTGDVIQAIRQWIDRGAPNN
jgi:hypothetical protein